MPVAIVTSILRWRSRWPARSPVGLDLVGPEDRADGTSASRASSASKSRDSSSSSAPGVWKPETWRERFSGSRTSWNQITSPLVEYRNGTPYSPWYCGCLSDASRVALRLVEDLLGRR